MEKRYVAYVGTYTHGHKNGIHIYDVNVEEGLLTKRCEVEVSNASYITMSKNGKYLYSIEDEGVAVFAVDANGDLTRINSIDIDGMRGCFLSTDATGKYLAVSGYHDGKVTLIATNPDGSLDRVLDGVYHRGIGSVAERNFRPHVNCVRPTPDNKYLCAVDNGIDQVKIYKIRKPQNKLKLVDILRCQRESGPRMIRFSSDGKLAYVLHELSNEIHVYSYDGTGKNPQFELLQKVDTLSDELDKMHDAACAIAMAPDGKHLFCSTAGDNSVAMYAVDQETHLLDKKFALPISGEYPKDLAIFPDSRHIAVANHESNTITTFAVDYEKNCLVMKGKPQKIEEPNCIKFYELGGKQVRK